MKSIAAQTAQERPQMNARWSAAVVPLMEQTVGSTRTTLLVLMGAVAFVLLIACLNVSNLLLMRASGRRREMTVRAALGAGRWRLLHQLAAESLLLSVTGGVLGFLLASWGVPALIGMLPAEFPLPRMSEIAVDRSVLGFTLAISLGCGLFFGLFPALQVDRAHLGEGLRQGGRTGTGGGRRLRNVLVVAEVAVAVILVIGAGLMLRSFQLLNHTDPGFRAERVVTFRMLLQFSKYGPVDRRTAFIQQLLDRVRAQPSVASASSIHLLPMTGMQSGSGYNRMDRPEPTVGSGTGGDVSVISDGYFRTMGIPLLAGRDFDSRDRIGSPYVAIINQAAANYVFPGESPLGKRLRIFWSPQNEAEIVGVAADIRHGNLALPPAPTLFLASMQGASLFASLVVRTNGNEASAIAAVKEQMHGLDPDQGIQGIQSMEAIMSEHIARPRLQAAVLSVFGVVAMVLACLGIYAVISYSVVQRTREMGIRLALGAAPRAILRGVIGEGMALSAMGIAAGIAAAFALTRFLEKLLYAIRPTDPMVFATVCGILAAAALAGCYFPARRATRVDPAVVLREE
jgi:putative ABC transport system permease protein